MKFKFENLGVLDKANIELKPLTIICGKNNTGKTYLSYAIYGFIKNWDEYFDIDIASNELAALASQGTVEINLVNNYVSQHEVLVKKAIENYKEGLAEFLAAQKDRFKNTKIDFSSGTEIADHESDIINLDYESTLNSGEGNPFVGFAKKAGSPYLRVTVLSDKEKSAIPGFIIEDTIKKVLWDKFFPKVFIVSAERTGAITFQSELNIKKNRLIEVAHSIKSSKSDSILKVFDALRNTGYPEPVSANIEFINQLNSLLQTRSWLADNYPDIITDFEEMAGGTYKVSKEGVITFATQKNKQSLGMGESSSSVKALVILGCYLKHIAGNNHLLIIDEPELNLHPSSQRNFARLVAQLVNAGVKVLLTTHSDYFVKEINTLLMLNNKNSRTEALRKEYGYKESEIISSDQIALYMTGDFHHKKEGGKRLSKGNILQEASINSKTGIEVKTFDEDINQMNEIQEKIYYAIEGVEE